MSEEEWDEGEDAGALIPQLTAIALDPRGVLRRRWIWMLLALIIGVAGSAGVYLQMKPTYRAKTTILVSSQQIPEEFVRSTVAGLDSLANVNALMGEVLSQRNLADLIIEQDLYPKLRLSEPLADVVETMRTSLVISQEHHMQAQSHNATSSIFAISYFSKDPKAAADVPNALAGVFIQANLAKRSEQAELTTDFLRRELEAAESELRATTSEIAQFQRENRGALPGDHETVLRKLERLELSKQTMNEQIAAAEKRLAALNDETGELSNAQKRLMELRMQLASQLAVHTDQHPNVIALRRRIAVMESEMSEINDLLEASTPREGESGQLADARREILRLRQRQIETDLEMQALDIRAGEIPDNEDRLDALEQRETVLRETYLEFLRKVQDAELTETLESAQQGAHFSILDRAAVPTDPIRSPLLIGVIGLLGTLGLAVLIGVGLELLDPVVLSVEHFKHLGDAPVLGSIHRLA